MCVCIPIWVTSSFLSISRFFHFLWFSVFLFFGQPTLQLHMFSNLACIFKLSWYSWPLGFQDLFKLSHLSSAAFPIISGSHYPQSTHSFFLSKIYPLHSEMLYQDSFVTSPCSINLKSSWWAIHPFICFQSDLSRVLVSPLVISDIDHIPLLENVSRTGKLHWEWDCTSSKLFASLFLPSYRTCLLHNLFTLPQRTFRTLHQTHKHPLTHRFTLEDCWWKLASNYPTICMVLTVFLDLIINSQICEFSYLGFIFLLSFVRWHDLIRALISRDNLDISTSTASIRLYLAPI